MQTKIKLRVQEGVFLEHDVLSEAELVKLTNSEF